MRTVRGVLRRRGAEVGLSRYRLLDAPHKGLRHLLGQWALAAGNTDVDDASELADFISLTSRVRLLLEDHARNEDEWVFPLAEARQPGACAGLHDAHERLDALLEEVFTSIEALGEKSTADDSWSMYLAVTEFQARYLMHLLEEERVLEPMLWSLYTDEELQIAEAKVAQGIDPALLLMWFAACAPARTLAEDAEVLINVRGVLPPEAFAQVLTVIEGELPAPRYSALISRLY